MPLRTPTPDGVLELFRDEIVVRPAEIEAEYDEIATAGADIPWERPYAGVEMLRSPAGPTLMRVSFARTIDRGGFDEEDRIRHELRQLWNDIRAAIPSESQVEFVGPGLTHIDRAEGLEILCHTHGIVREI